MSYIPTYFSPKYLASDISTNLPITYLLTYLMYYLFTYPSTNLRFTYLSPIYISTTNLLIFLLLSCLPTNLPISYLPIYIQTYTYLPKTYLFPTYLSTYITNIPFYLLTFLHLNLAITYLLIYLQTCVFPTYKETKRTQSACLYLCR